MKKKISIGIILVVVLTILIFAFYKTPVVSSKIEIPENYMEAVKEQAQGVYSSRLPLIPVYVRVDSYVEEKIFYTIYYFPFGTVGMSYIEGDGYNIEKSLSRLS